jgi:hypothetical protein
MQLALYVHPFDLRALDAHGGLARLRDLGFGELSMATSYHDGRWLTPWNPERRVRFLEDGCVHFRPDGDYGELQPVPSSEVPTDGPSPLQRLCTDAGEAGLQVRAWTVFGHNTPFGLRAPQLSVANAHGDRYPYALCPAQPAVRAYHTQLVRELAAHEGVGTIELEALGQMGIQHSSHHDKKSFSPKGLLAFALSACFCDACMVLHRELGQDGEAHRQQVRAFVDAMTTDADAMAPPSPPDDDAALDEAQRAWVDAVIAVRARSVQRMAEAVVAASGDVARAVQVHPDRWFTGSQLSAASAEAFPATDQRVFTCYGENPEQIAALLEHDGARATAGSPRRLCIWPKAPQFTSDEDLVKTKALCAEHGIDSIAVYHLGLLPWRTVERVAKILGA